MKRAMMFSGCSIDGGRGGGVVEVVEVEVVEVVEVEVVGVVGGWNCGV